MFTIATASRHCSRSVEEAMEVCIRWDYERPSLSETVKVNQFIVLLGPFAPLKNSVQTFAEGSIVNMMVDSFVMSGVVMIAATRE